jgi:Flp pilus assembly protein TadG
MEKRSSLFGRLLRDQRGVIALTFAVTFSVMLGSSLMALDFVRYNVAQARIQNALDTAVISAGRKLANYQSTGPGYDPGQAWRDDATAYFKANVPDKFLGVAIPPGALTIDYGEDRVNAGGQTSDSGQFLSAQRISMSVTGTLPLMSTGFVRETGLEIDAQNWAVRRVRNDLELVLALDNTGSMNDPASSTSTKIQVLRDSATQLINTVMAASAAGGQTDGTSGAYIGLVPFTDSVNVGGIASSPGWLNGATPAQKNYIQSLWTGCIVEPGPASGGNWTAANPLPATLLSPASLFKPMLSVHSFDYAPPTLTSTGGNSTRAYNRLVQDSTLLPSGFAFNAPTSASKDRRVTADVAAWSTNPQTFTVNLAQEPSNCTLAPTYFLTKDQTALLSAVAAMKGSGSTAVPTGLIWAWRMLSPQWRGAAGWGSSTLPRDGDSKLRKVIILLSDGDNDPTVRRGSNSPGTDEWFKLSYAYQECTKTQSVGSGRNAQTVCQTYSNTVKRVSNESGRVKLSSFNQCPIIGLRSVDPAQITPANYDNSCASSGPNSSTIGYPDGSKSGTTINSNSLDAYGAQLCANIKADPNNITLFTLTLGMDVSDEARAVMRGCASDPTKTYFDVSNAADLPQVFNEIAGALTELRLTQDPGTSSGS